MEFFPAPHIRAAVRKVEVTRAKSRCINHIGLWRNAGSKGRVSGKRTLQLAQECDDSPHNLGVRAIAQMDGPLEAVGKRMDNEPVVFERATGAKVGTIAEEEEMERLFREPFPWRECGFFGLAMDRGQKGTAEIGMQRAALSAQPNQVTKRKPAKSRQGTECGPEKEGNLFEFPPEA